MPLGTPHRSLMPLQLWSFPDPAPVLLPRNSTLGSCKVSRSAPGEGPPPTSISRLPSFQKTAPPDSCIVNRDTHNRESSLVKTLKHAATTCTPANQSSCARSGILIARAHTSNCSSLSLAPLISSDITCPKFCPIPWDTPARFPNGHCE